MNFEEVWSASRSFRGVARFGLGLVRVWLGFVQVQGPHINEF